MAITRFAPSPTGYLHIGGLRTSLYSYLWARKTGGVFRLRVEDTDTARNNEDAMEAIINAFDWVGLNYDGEVFYQSKRTDVYKIYIDKLLESGKAYKCYMSKDELDALRARQETLVWTDTALYSLTFIGQPFTFGVNLVNEGVGLVGPNAMINTPKGVFWMDKKGW